MCVRKIFIPFRCRSSRPPHHLSVERTSLLLRVLYPATILFPYQQSWKGERRRRTATVRNNRSTNNTHSTLAVMKPVRLMRQRGKNENESEHHALAKLAELAR